jgi:hypothetical protein
MRRLNCHQDPIMHKPFDLAEDDDFDERFWGAPDHWPVDTDEHVFLARAFNELGRNEYGDAWDYLGPTEPRDDSDEADIDHIDECEAAEDRYKELRRLS